MEPEAWSQWRPCLMANRPVARPTGQHLANYRLIKSVTAPETPINTPLPMEFNTPHYTCSSPLVKVPV
jgi:hypothetical protein